MKSSDGRECSAFVRHKKIALKGRRTTKLYLLNPAEREVERVEVDGCAITAGQRCDWLVKVNDSNSEIYVELKSSAVSSAAEQLRETIRQLSADCAKLPKRCLVVFNRNPMAGTDMQNLKIKFRSAFNSTFDFVRNESEVTL